MVQELAVLKVKISALQAVLHVGRETQVEGELGPDAQVEGRRHLFQGIKCQAGGAYEVELLPVFRLLSKHLAVELRQKRASALRTGSYGMVV